MRIHLKELRRQAKLTQEQLGAMCDPPIPGVYISRYEKQPGEKGYVRMPDTLLPQLARSLNVHPSAIISYDSEEVHASFTTYETAPIASIPRATVPVVGYVMAGSRVEIFNSSESEIDRVPCPPGMDPDKTKAYEGIGESGEPFFYAGWLFYREETYPGVPIDFIGRICMVKVREDEHDAGNTLIKRVQRGSKPGHYDLHSINPAEAVIKDAMVEWSSFIRMMEQRR